MTRPGVLDSKSKTYGFFVDFADYLAETQRDGKSLYSAWKMAREESIFHDDKEVMDQLDKEFEIVVRMIAPEIAQDAITARNATLLSAKRADEVDSLFPF